MGYIKLPFDVNLDDKEISSETQKLDRELLKSQNYDVDISIQSQKIVNFIKSLYPDKSVIPLHEPTFNGKEKEYVQDCIDSTFVSSIGKYVNQFEDMVQSYTGTKHAIATVNGTAALHISLLLAGDCSCGTL